MVKKLSIRLGDAGLSRTTRCSSPGAVTGKSEGVRRAKGFVEISFKGTRTAWEPRDGVRDRQSVSTEPAHEFA